MASMETGQFRSKPRSCAAITTESAAIVTDILFLLGRGGPIIRNAGNVWFRSIIHARKKDYMGTGRHRVKNEIAKQVLKVIEQSQGRFLRRMSSEEAVELGLPTGARAWLRADDARVLEKVKQALRDNESSEDCEDTEAMNPSENPPPAVLQEREGDARNGSVALSVPSLDNQSLSLDQWCVFAQLCHRQEVRRLQMAVLRRPLLGVLERALVDDRRWYFSSFVSNTMSMPSSSQASVSLSLLERVFANRDIVPAMHRGRHTDLPENDESVTG
jgi:hypothetical protein